jgi:DNA-binding CsgD family transcriptional regulator/catechol 2,3-dioxygenase-like lactoylglutathione lyase family enzyme
VLTPAECRIVNGVRHGMTNRQIARLRSISLDAVKFHIASALGKLSLSHRAELKTWRGVPADSALKRSNETMNAELKLGEIGQIARSVKDIEAAERWFRDVLGLPHLYTFGKLAFFDCGGTRLYLQEGPSEVEGQNNDSVLYFRVADINAAYDELQRRGVSFEGAPHLIFKHPDGMEEWMAFFRDMDGGYLALMSQVRSDK